MCWCSHIVGRSKCKIQRLKILFPILIIDYIIALHDVIALHLTPLVHSSHSHRTLSFYPTLALHQCLIIFKLINYFCRKMMETTTINLLFLCNGKVNAAYIYNIPYLWDVTVEILIKYK